MTESVSHRQSSSRRGNGRIPDAHHDGLKLTCCGCMDIRRGVILTLWVQFTIVTGAAIALLVFLVALPGLLAFDKESDQSPLAADAKARLSELRVSLWIYFAVYLTLAAFTCVGLATVKYRKLAAYKSFVAINIAVLGSELVLSLAVQPFHVLAIVELVLRVYWVWVFYRYIATLTMEVEHIERQKELEVELYQ